MSKLIYKDLDKIIVEITSSEFEEKGFDVIWDEIREVYDNKYKLIEHYYSNDNKIINFVLKLSLF
jgi:hypothetical protein